MEIKQVKKNPLKLRNSSRLGARAITISLPEELLLKINSVIEGGKRSAWICRVILQHFTKTEEDDPRYRLKEKQTEYEVWKRGMRIQKSNAENKVKQIEVLTEKGDKDYKAEITKLEQEAKDKMKELIEE